MPDYSSFNDEQLLARLSQGDESAFAEIYNRYWEKLLAIGYYHTRDKQAAEDIVHEVMLTMWTRRAELNVQSLSAYLATAVKFSVFKEIARDRRRRDLLSAPGVYHYPPDIDSKLETRFLEQTLEGALDELPEKTRLVFTYSRVNELSIKEIAQKMELSPKAVEYHITKALRSLRETLKKIKLFFV